MSEEYIGTLRVYCSCGMGAPPVIDTKFIGYDKPATYVKAVIRYKTWSEWFCEPWRIDVNIEYKVGDRVYWFKNVKGVTSGTEVIQLPPPDLLNKMHQLAAWGAQWYACWPVETRIDLYAVSAQPTPPPPSPTPTPPPPGDGGGWDFSPWLFVFMAMMMAIFVVVVAVAVKR
jgi:hypothetical protein